MSKTFYYIVWSSITLSDLVNAIESDPGYTDVVIFGPEEYEPGALWISPEQYLLIKRFLDYHNVELKIVFGSPIDKDLNPKYKFIDLPNMSAWPTYFSNFVVNYNVMKDIYPYGHNNIVTKHFTSLNARAHPWRCMFVDYIYKYGLFDKGYVSWHNSENWDYVYNFRWWTPETINFDSNWINNTDGVLDIFNPPVEQFRDSLFSLISESTTECIFVTEKTYIPIYHKRPFLIFGAPRTHEYLKSLGFKMFDELIDYSFDLIEDDEKRCNALMHQMLKLSKHDIQKIKRIAKPKTEYNFLNLLRLVCNKKLVSKDVRRIVDSIDQNTVTNYKNTLNIGKSSEFIDFITKNKIDLTKKD